MYDLFFNSRISYILQVIPVTILAGGLYVLWCAWKNIQWDRNRVVKCLFVCYQTALFSIVLTPANFWNDFWFGLLYGVDLIGQTELFQFSFNLVPTVFRYLTGSYTGGSWIVFMTIANILLLVPYGILHPLAYPGKSTLKAGWITIFTIELLQPIVSRSFDVDDMIYNGLGLMIGYGIYHLVVKIRGKT